jgi:hypothetical protein
MNALPSLYILDKFIIGIAGTFVRIRAFHHRSLERERIANGKGHPSFCPAAAVVVVLDFFFLADRSIFSHLRLGQST